MFYAYLSELNKHFWGTHHSTRFIPDTTNFPKAGHYVYFTTLFPGHSSVSVVCYYETLAKGIFSLIKIAKSLIQ